VKILVTGMSGLIGTALGRQLGASHELRALNRRPVSGVLCHQADIGDLAAIEPAFEGIEVVVHLAAHVGETGPFDAILGANVVGTRNVFEAARRAGVRRVVYASSGAVVSGYEREMPYRALVEGRYGDVERWPKLTHESPPRPSGLYGVSKLWGEALARHYADAHGLSMLGIRIGHVVAEDRPLTVRDFTVWCSRRDAVRMLELCIRAPDTVRCDVFFLLSDNRWSYRDLEHPRTVLGYEPLDRAEDHRT
jgi:nucleoside-diphosphate-sugar epimerase